MNKIFLGAVAAASLINSASAIEQKLPEPDKQGGIPLMQALNERKSIKEFTNKEIDAQTLSEVLWAAYGVNRSGGLRTIPTAMNQKDLDIFVAKKDGVWQYNAVDHELVLISNENILPAFATQDYMKNVPAVLIYTGSRDEDYPAMHAGSAYQNVELYAASRGMASVVRGYFEKADVAKALKLPSSKRVIISQAIGWEE